MPPMSQEIESKLFIGLPDHMKGLQPMVCKMLFLIHYLHGLNISFALKNSPERVVPLKRLLMLMEIYCV